MSSKPAGPNQPIIIVKKVVAGGHHGGAWKVAYADFVTAMMALFIVLWLMNASPEIQKAVSLYFTDPRGFHELDGSGTVGTTSDESLLLSKEDMPELKERLTKTLKALPQLGALKEQVEMTVTGDGLRIELLDKEGYSFFDTGSRELTSSARDVVSALAREIGRLENPIVIEGHTDARPFSNRGYYSNWDLSTDRANFARRYMAQQGLKTGQIVQLRGFADRQLRKPDDPNDYSNRRVSIIVGFLDPPAPDSGNSQPAATSEPVSPSGITSPEMSDPPPDDGGSASSGF